MRGRLGYLVTPTLLAYATGGLAYGQAKFTTNIIQSGLTVVPSFSVFPAINIAGAGLGGTSFSDTRVGWTVGGGLEWLFWPNWSAKVEYLYYDLGNVSTGFIVANNFGGGPFAAQSTTRFNGHIVRAGLNYHFNLFTPAPVIVSR